MRLRVEIRWCPIDWSGFGRTRGCLGFYEGPDVSRYLMVEWIPWREFRPCRERANQVVSWALQNIYLRERNLSEPVTSGYGVPHD